MIRRTHNLLQWAFAIFVLYLLISRLLVFWVQFFPASFLSVLGTISSTDIQVEEIHVEQDWLGFQLELEGTKVKSTDFSFQADEIKADFNTFFFVLPAVDYGDYLTVKRAAYQANKPKAVVKLERNLTLEQLLTVDINIHRLWKRVNIDDVVVSDIHPDLTIQLHELNSLKGTRLSLVSEFSVIYRDALYYDRFNFKSTFSSNLWGGLDKGEFSLKSFKPMRIERLAKLLSVNWQKLLPDGEMIIDLHGVLRNSQMQNLVLQLNGQSLNWKQNVENLPSNAGLSLDWQQDNQLLNTPFFDWTFKVSQIQLDNRFIESVSPVALNFEQGEFLHFNAEKLDIEPFQLILKALLKTDLFGQFFDRAVNLNIANLNGKLDWQTLEVPELKLQLERVDLPVTDYPGMSLQAFSLEKKEGLITVSTPHPVLVMAPEIHSKPLQLELPNSFAFSYDNRNQAWALSKLNFSIDKVPVFLDISQINESYIDATFSANFVTMQKLKKYLPYDLMSPKLQAWLKESLLGGKDIEFDGQIRGLYRNFPFIEQNGHFSINAKVHDAKLRFNSKWPVLKGFDANLRFRPFELSIDVEKVNVGAGNFAENVKVIIPDLDKEDIALRVSGELDTSLDKAANYLTISPIAGKIGLQDFLKNSAKLSGDARVEISEIWVPISGLEKRGEQVNGRLRFNNSNISVLDRLEFKNLNGYLDFSESRVDSKGLKFDSLGGNGKFTVKTNPTTKQVVIKGSGYALKERNEWFNKPVKWNSELEIPFRSSSQQGVSLRADFLIHQSESKLPAPFSRENLEKQKRKLKLTTEFNNDSVDASVDIEGLVDTQIYWKVQGSEYLLNGFQVFLGDKKLRKLTAKKSESFVSGSLQEFELSAWSKAYHQLNKSLGTGLSNPVEWSFSNVNIERAGIFGNEFDDLKISWQSSAGLPFQLDVLAENVSGKVVFSSEDYTDVKLDYLNLVSDKSYSDSIIDSDCGEKTENYRPTPVIRFEAKQVALDNKIIDSLKFEVDQSPDVLVVKSIDGRFGDGTGVIKGGYQFDKEANLSSLSLNLKSSKIAEVTKFLEVNKGFSGNRAEVGLKLNWKGGLNCFSVNKFIGDVNFELKDGAIEDIEPGIARLIGLLSVESLVRRLQLDLTDITNKGMVFDEIKGRAKIDNGNVNLTKLKLKAPSATGEIEGSISLKHQTFDLEAKITPKVGATIPTIAALAGNANPLAALAVYTIMKVIPGINENLVTYEYEVLGPWKSPDISVRNQPLDNEQKAVEDLLDRDE